MIREKGVTAMGMAFATAEARENVRRSATPANEESFDRLERVLASPKPLRPLSSV